MIAKVCITATILALGIGVAHADDWAGFYIGIDGLDGSIDRMSIVPNGDGSYDVRLAASYFSVCGAPHPAAMMMATGSPDGDTLLLKNAIRRCDDSGSADDLPEMRLSHAGSDGIVSFPAPHDQRPLANIKVSSGPGADDDWAGFYIGIDAADASVDRMTIVPTGDGTYDIGIKAAKFGACDTAHPDAVRTAVGRPVEDKLRNTDGLLRCDGREDGKPVADIDMFRDPKTGIVTFGGSDGRELAYHRVGG